MTTEFKLNKEYLAKYAGWRVEDFPLRRHPDKVTILDEAEKLINNPDLLFERVTKDHSAKDTESGVVIALQLLQAYADAPKCESSTLAANILRAIGRRDLLPKTPSGKPETNKTSNAWIYYWQRDPEDLIDSVGACKANLLGLFEGCPENHERRRDPPRKLFTPRGSRPVYQCCLGYAFKAETGKDLPEDFDTLGWTKGDYLALMALRFISCKEGIPFDELQNYFYKVTKGGKLRPYQGMSPTEALKKSKWEKLDQKSGLEFYPLDFVESKKNK